LSPARRLRIVLLSQLVREVDRQTAVGKHPSGRRAESDVELSFSEEEEEDNPGSSEQVCHTS